MEMQKQYYLAVDRHRLKMATLVDLIKVLVRKRGLPLIICCSSRDSLDAHSDLSDAERHLVLETFQKAVTDWNLCSEESAERDIDGGIEVAQSHLLVVTDACLPSQALSEAPLSARILINYDLPAKKELYQRRLAACMGHPTVASSDGFVISMLVGGEVALLRNIEEGCGIVIEEMPIQIFELL